MIIGGMSDKARQKAVDTFKESDNIRVVVGNETAAGTGTSFVSTNVVVTAEQSWVPGENDQVSKRVCRIGQKNPGPTRGTYWYKGLWYAHTELCRP